MLDIGAPEILVLAVIAVIVFGPEKLPQFARKAAKALRYVRQMAGSAQTQLKSELGTDFDDLDFRDLNPKTFVAKHLLGDIEPLANDMKDELKGLGSLGKDTVGEATAAINEAKSSARVTTRTSVSTRAGVTATMVPALEPVTAGTPFDPDAT
ncbi:twin-arginine translocase subunit TatB [Microlunatus elymi]|uniref:Sec-independent protein translocase protein TatB n=1 Tax=Microlunatus elymi TaxID=2596828 RepID=A0A516Q314_9ACTN|nr:sec-independent translocase [Microlunatus elymi]QDP97823.1 twin-arginine translocase subunit TatB [Microlunatus elymi]